MSGRPRPCTEGHGFGPRNSRAPRRVALSTLREISMPEFTVTRRQVDHSPRRGLVRSNETGCVSSSQRNLPMKGGWSCRNPSTSNRAATVDGPHSRSTSRATRSVSNTQPSSSELSVPNLRTTTTTSGSSRPHTRSCVRRGSRLPIVAQERTRPLTTLSVTTRVSARWTVNHGG